MKKIFIIFTFILLGIGTFILFQKNSHVSDESATDVMQTSNRPETAESESAVEKIPKRLRIPSIGVDAYVENVGMDDKGRMDVPKEDMNVAWYELGYLPGQKGSAVMAGHLDTQTGSPAVFARVETLRVGEKIIVVHEDGSETNFRVTGKNVYEAQNFPLQEVFGSTDAVRLNLITCEGTYDRSSRNYSHRTVIYAELAK